MMPGYSSKKAAALDEKGMYLVHQTAQPAPVPERKHHRHTWGKDGEGCVVCGDKDWMDTSCKLPAQPAQEPVAWGVFEGNLHDMFFSQKEAQEMADLKGIHAEVRPLYTAPPQRPWVGLTDEEMKKIWYEMQNIMGWYSFQEISKAIEAKLKERNS